MPVIFCKITSLLFFISVGQTMQNIYMSTFNTSNAKLYWPNLTINTTQTCRFSTGPNFSVYIPVLRLSVLPKLSIIKSAWKKLIDYRLSNYAVGNTSVGLTGRKAGGVGRKIGGGEKKKIGYNRGKKGAGNVFGGHYWQVLEQSSLAWGSLTTAVAMTTPGSHP